MVRAKRQNWSGKPPRNEAEARARLIQAALTCAQNKGLARTTVADIAAEAGVTRPTVYSHFQDRHAVFHAAFMEAVGRLAVGAREAMLAKSTAGERAVEAVTYFAIELPRDPCLKLIISGEGFGEFTSQALLEGEAIAQARAILAPVFELVSLPKARADETTEVIVRFALSLIMIPGPQSRTRRQLRGFLRRRLLPSLALPDAEPPE